MATGQDLVRMLRSVRNNIENNIPRLVAEAMMEETNDNFAKSQYGNDEQPQRWADRMGFTANGNFGNMEPYLRYKKLIYSGRLLRGIKPISGKGFAALQSSAPYSEAHNEGSQYPTGGNSRRLPPYSTQLLWLGQTPQKRQFMGVGKRTYNKVIKIYSRQLRRLT